MSNATKMTCTRCNRAAHVFSGAMCADCKRKERADEVAKAERRLEQQARLGFVGDERRVQQVLKAFDAFSLDVRAAAGCPRGASR